MAVWEQVTTDADIGLMSRTLAISEQLSRLLANRGIRTRNTAVRYLSPGLDKLRDVSLMKDIDRALALIDRNKRTAVYGDYDADGVTSTAIIYKMLTRYGVDCCYYVPHREEEGYGLNKDAILALAEDDVKLLICCDNGISAPAEVSYAKELGMEVIIIDHHEPGFVTGADGTKHDVVPPADAVIDPKQQSCPYPFKELCAGGLAFKFAAEFYRRNGLEFAERDEFLVLAMIATLCDIADLTDENRIIAKAGLLALNNNKRVNVGLWALISERGCEEREINEFVIGFIIGPCINATGRLARASIAVELLITDDSAYAGQIAAALSELNEQRKKLTAAAAESALAACEAETDKLIVIRDDTIHESVAGIVAGRIKDALYRPVIVLTRSGGGDEDGGDVLVKGSARSIEGYNMFEELFKCRELFERFGGHAMAAGMSLRSRNVDKLRERLVSTCTLTGDDLVSKLRIDMELGLDEVTYRLVSDISVMAPFGKANRQPLFAVRNVRVAQVRVIKEKNTLIFTLSVPGGGVNNGGYSRKIKGVCFGMVDEFEKRLGGRSPDNGLIMDLAFSPELNEYNGNTSVQMRIRDFIITAY